MTSHLKTLRNRLILLIVVYFLLRLLFLFFNFNLYGLFPFHQLLLAFLYGLRFDLSAIFLLNFPLILLSLVLPDKSRWPHFLTHGLFLILNVPFILANLADLEYFKYTGKRMGLDVAIFKNEAANQLGQFLKNYWPIVLIAICLTLILHILGRQRKSRIPRPLDYTYRGKAPLWVLLRRSLGGLLIITMALFIIRGGFQKKVLKPIKAFNIGHFDLGHLVLNSTFTLLMSKPSRGFNKKATYFKTKKEALQYLPRPAWKKREAKRDNVVLIILESFGSEFWGAANDYPGHTPFLDSLAQKGLFFKRNFSSSRISLNALFDILFGIPPLINAPLAKSNYQQNKWKGLGQVLAEVGYHTSFFHGNDKNSLYFGDVSARAGLKEYYHMRNYPHKKSHIGILGVYDRPFFQFAAQKIASYPAPFFSTIFSLTSHEPFEVPPQEKSRFQKGPLQIHNAIRYTDDSLRGFFETAQKMPWFKDTLFIITGDHTQPKNGPSYNTTIGRFMVPLLIYHPGKNLPPARVDQVTYHSDIFPTILDYLGLSPNEWLLFGHSVFDNTQEDQALFYLQGYYWLVENDYILEYNPDQEKSLLFSYSDRVQKYPLTHPKVKSKMLNKLRAYIQYFQNGLIENNLYRAAK